MTETKEFELKYSHNVIEHLGLKLYQNRPTNVLAELVSNSWDADAENVWLDIERDRLAVYDDGDGMTREVLADNYLVIGKKKRTADNVDELTTKGRRLMGRKGIGKLAPFGIARKLSLLTVSRRSGLCYWIEIDLHGLLSESHENSSHQFSYKPNVICDGVEIKDLPSDNDKYGYVKRFLSSINDGGTLVMMDNLSLKRIPSKDKLREAIGQRFTVTLLRDDFNVYVENEKVTEKQALPKFLLRIPETGFEEETININGEDRFVRYWVGFVEQAEWPQDQAGVGVYAHGKIAQDRPFVFGLKGREISTRYMYGVIEADWLDELDEDVVSTDRTSVNWENDSTEPMYEWGQKLVAQWITKYRNHQKVENDKKVTEKLNNLPDIPRITAEEKSTIKDMVCTMSPRIYRDDSLQTEVITKLTSAWTHRPTRSIIKSLWDRLQSDKLNEEEFVSTLNDIHRHLVPESLSLSVTVAQKIYALTQLNQLSINGTERQLQSLLETFPWILGAEKGKVSANQQLKSLAKEATLNGNVPNHGYTAEELRQLADTPDAKTRPDFCFFSDENKRLIVVVELKSPLVPLEYSHLMQLLSYYYWLKKTYPDASIKGYLIGQNTGNAIESENNNIDVLTWERVCIRTRKDYLDLLATMLSGVSDHYDDVRIKDVFEFGGEETRELLKRMADIHSPLNDFFEINDKKLEK